MDATVVVLDSKGEEISERVPVTIAYVEDPEPAIRLSDSWVPGPFRDPSDLALYNTKGEMLCRIPIRLEEVAEAEGLGFPRLITMT